MTTTGTSWWRRPAYCTAKLQVRFSGRSAGRGAARQARCYAARPSHSEATAHAPVRSSGRTGAARSARCGESRTATGEAATRASQSITLFSPYNSELKTDLNLERLPSGKFATNDLVLCAGLVAYNLLRVIGQISLQESDAPVRTKVHRRRVKTVIENLIWLASRLVEHARQTKLRFGRHSPWFPTFRRIYMTLSG